MAKTQNKATKETSLLCQRRVKRERLREQARKELRLVGDVESGVLMLSEGIALAGLVGVDKDSLLLYARKK